jgi:hypothetical protein
MDGDIGLLRDILQKIERDSGSLNQSQVITLLCLG